MSLKEQNPIELAKIYGIHYLMDKYFKTRDDELKKKCLDEIKRIAEYGKESEKM